MTPPVTHPMVIPGEGQRLPGATRIAGGWLASAVVAFLLLVVTVPVASGEDQVAVVIALLLSLAGGLALRHPVLAAVTIAVVLTIGVGLGPAHIGFGILASSISAAACAARGHLLTSIGLAAWQLLPPTASSLIRGDEAEYLVSQVMLWIILQTTAVLAGSWGRALVQHAGAERARRVADLAEQRRAIARELHDTGVRAMTQVVMLSENAGRREGTSPADEAEFARISVTARQATEELRDLLETLRIADRGDGAALNGAVLADRSHGSCSPSPRTALGSLRRRLATEGFTVQIGIEGDGDLPEGADGVLGRCLGEIEANVIRHGDRTEPVSILADLHGADAERGAGIDLLVRNGVADSRPRVLHGGAGLAGMHERLAAVGGRLETRVEGCRFLTHVTIPGSLDRTGAS